MIIAFSTALRTPSFNGLGTNIRESETLWHGSNFGQIPMQCSQWLTWMTLDVLYWLRTGTTCLYYIKTLPQYSSSRTLQDLYLQLYSHWLPLSRLEIIFWYMLRVKLLTWLTSLRYLVHKGICVPNAMSALRHFCFDSL